MKLQRQQILALAIALGTLASLGIHQYRVIHWRREVSTYDEIFMRTSDAAQAAMMQYVKAHGGRFPDADHWECSLAPYWSGQDEGYVQAGTCIVAENPDRRLAMNRRLSRARLGDQSANAKTILFFVTDDTSRNANGTPPHYSTDDEMRRDPIHNFQVPAIIYVDGHLPDY